MFKFICLLALASSAIAASIGNIETTTKIPRPIVPLLSYERENNPDGSFQFSYEGGDKSYRQETAHVVDAGTEDEALEVSGSYRYIDDEGNVVEVHYTAGKNGFVPIGTNILSEITAAAKAAADLPKINEEEIKRKGRSNEAVEKTVGEVKEVKAVETPIIVKVEEVKPVETVVTPVVVKAEEQKVEKVETPAKVETPVVVKVEEKKVEKEETPAVVKVEEKKVETA